MLDSLTEQGSNFQKSKDYDRRKEARAKWNIEVGSPLKNYTKLSGYYSVVTTPLMNSEKDLFC